MKIARKTLHASVRAAVAVTLWVVTTVLAACGGGDRPTPPLPATGGLFVVVYGIPASGTAAVQITGPGGSFTVARDTTIRGLPVGTYAVRGQQVVVGGQVFADTASAAPTFEVAQDRTIQATVQYVFRSTAVRVVLTGLPAGLGAMSAVDFTFTDSTGAPRTVRGLSTSAVGVVTEVPPGTYRVASPAVENATQRFRPDSSTRVVVIPPAATVLLAVPYAQSSGRVTVLFGAGLSGPVGATLVDVAGVVVGRVSTGAPTLDKVEAGTYRVVGDTVRHPLFVTEPTVAVVPVVVTAAQTGAATVSYAGRPLPGFNVRVVSLDVVQAISKRTLEVPLVSGRAALVRVGLEANSRNGGVAPAVSIEVTSATGQVRTLRAPAGRGWIPTTTQPDTLESTWNVMLPATWVEPGIRLRAVFDPDGIVPGDPTSDNAFPAVGSGAVDVRVVPDLVVTLVPILKNGRAPVVSQSLADSLLDFTRAALPVRSLAVRVRTPFAAGLVGANSPSLLDSLRVLRDRDGRPRTEIYVALVDTSFGGLGVLGGTLATAAFASFSFTSAVIAHEMGHLLGALHPPGCGLSVFLDPSYPYVGPPGIGSWGWDQRTGRLVPRTATELMGGCALEWVSDYIWNTTLRVVSGQSRPLAPPFGFMVR